MNNDEIPILFEPQMYYEYFEKIFSEIQERIIQIIKDVYVEVGGDENG